MNIKCEAIDQNHEFCIDKQSVKQLFENCDINISFKKGDKLPYKNGKLMPESSTKHEVACLLVSKPQSIELGKFSTILYPLLNFYSVDKRYLTDKLKEQFTYEILPMLFSRYNQFKDDINDRRCVTVYISNEKFEIKETQKYSI